MGEVFHEHRGKSRIRRICSWCGEYVEAGEVYESYRWRSGSDYGRETLHRECHAAMRELVAVDGPWVEWGVGEFCRGCACAAGDCKCGQGVT